MKYFLVFLTLDGCREDCNVFYSHLVTANDEDDAINKYNNHCISESKKKGYVYRAPDPNSLGVREMKLIK